MMIGTCTHQEGVDIGRHGKLRTAMQCMCIPREAATPQTVPLAKPIGSHRRLRHAVLMKQTKHGQDECKQPEAAHRLISLSLERSLEALRCNRAVLGRYIAGLKQCAVSWQQLCIEKQWTTVPLVGATFVENWCSAGTNNVRHAQPTYARSQPSSMVSALHLNLCIGRKPTWAGVSMAALQDDPNNSQYRRLATR